MSEGDRIEKAIMSMQEQMLFLERHVEELDLTVRDLARRLDAVGRDVSLLTRRVDQHRLDQESPGETSDDDANAQS